jgi:hypothetical protein
MWFVILRSQQGKPVPFVEDNEEMATFETEEEARTAVKGNVFAENFGYEVYEL